MLVFADLFQAVGFDGRFQQSESDGNFITVDGKDFTHRILAFQANGVAFH